MNEAVDHKVGGLVFMANRVRIATCLLFGVWCLGCSSSDMMRDSVTVVASEGFQEFEGFVPIPPDSVARLYRIYDRKRFYETYTLEIQRTAELIDSLNQEIPARLRIDTLSIEFAPEQFGTAVRTGGSIYISSGFYFVYDDPSVIRSIIFHEYGHIRFEMLSGEAQRVAAGIWSILQRAALLYVFVDGEYSGNAWFGGHPDESPEELFASAFNLFHNRPDELRARLKYVPQDYYGLIDSLKRSAGVEKLVLFE